MTIGELNKFPPGNRLRHRWEFMLVRNKGRSLHTRHFILVFLEKNNGPSRLGITVSKKIGNSVIRNHLKRLIREFFRVRLILIRGSLDISIIAKKGAGDLSLGQITAELGFLFEDGGIANRPCSGNS